MVMPTMLSCCNLLNTIVFQNIYQLDITTAIIESVQHAAIRSHSRGYQFFAKNYLKAKRNFYMKLSQPNKSLAVVPINAFSLTTTVHNGYSDNGYSDILDIVIILPL